MGPWAASGNAAAVREIEAGIVPVRAATSNHDAGADRGRAALDAFCAAATAGVSCAATDVRPLGPRSPGRRLGVFELDDTDRSAWAVVLRRDAGSSRWVIGTGLRPIVPAPRARRAGSPSRPWPFARFEPVDTERPAWAEDASDSRVSP